MLKSPGRSALQLPRTTRGDFYGILFTSERIDGAIARVGGDARGQGTRGERTKTNGTGEPRLDIDPSPEVVYLVPNEWCCFIDFPNGGWWLSNSPKWIVFEDSSGDF